MFFMVFFFVGVSICRLRLSLPSAGEDAMCDVPFPRKENRNMNPAKRMRKNEHCSRRHHQNNCLLKHIKSLNADNEIANHTTQLDEQHPVAQHIQATCHIP